MNRALFLHLLLPGLLLSGNTQAQSKPQTKPNHSAEYFPPPGEWQHRSPAAMGLDSGKLQEAIQYARDKEPKAPRNMELAQVESFGKEPFSEGIGPFADRGDPTGIIIYKGYIVAEWGEPQRVVMTHSVTKSFLSTVIGLAVDQGLIHSVTDTVAAYVPPIEVYDLASIARPAEALGKPQMLYPFSGPHNRTLTWDVMLRQTSDWEGVLWGKPDWADRPNPADKPADWINRKRMAQSPPQILKTYIMDPIGASNTWRWNGYRNSWIVLDGQPVQSVCGGGHRGGSRS